MEYLLNSAAIKNRIADIFSGDQEKWAIVAFVGHGALDQLPKGIKNLSVVCWPKAGATHPDGVRRLLQAGIAVYFCEGLHSKIYWSKGRGQIVGSANLSANALSTGLQHECGVFTSNPVLPLDKVLRDLVYQPVTEDRLAALDIEHAKARSREPDADFEQSTTLSYLEARRLALPRRWKLLPWWELRTDSNAIKEVVLQQTGGNKWVNDNDVDEGLFQEGDFVLQFKLDEGDQIGTTRSIKWMRIDLIRKIRGTWTAIQLRPLSDGPPPPFEIDTKFRRAFKAAFNSCEWDDIEDQFATPTDPFMVEIERQY